MRKRVALQISIKDVVGLIDPGDRTEYADVAIRTHRITNAFDEFVNDGNQLDIDTFNVFIKALNDIKGDKGMKVRHQYYEFAVEQIHLIPNTITFNLMLKGVRHSRPALFRFVPYFLDEMKRFNVSYDDCTFNELISLCSRFPTAENVEAAKSWFLGYQMKRQRDGERYNELVLNSYLNVLVMANDRVSSLKYVEWLRERAIWNKRFQHTFEKMEIIKDNMHTRKNDLVRRVLLQETVPM